MSGRSLDEPTGEPPEGEGRHTIDLRPLDADGREAVEILLDLEGVAHEIHGDALVVARAEREHVEDLLAIVVEMPHTPDPGGRDPLFSIPPAPGEVDVSLDPDDDDDSDHPAPEGGGRDAGDRHDDVDDHLDDDPGPGTEGPGGRAERRRAGAAPLLVPATRPRGRWRRLVALAGATARARPWPPPRGRGAAPGGRAGHMTEPPPFVSWQ